MIERETKLKKWGNSIGIVIPKEEIEKENLKINQKVRVIINPISPIRVKDIFGKFKKIKKPTKKIMKEIDRELESKFLK